MEDKKKANKKSNNTLKGYSRFSGIVIQMGVIIGLGSWGGSQLDEKFNSETPIYTIILSLSSVGLALYLIIKEVIKMGKNNE